MSNYTSIVWFKRDLRIHDHAPLYTAAQQGAVIPLYIVEPDYWETRRHEWATVELHPRISY